MTRLKYSSRPHPGPRPASVSVACSSSSLSLLILIVALSIPCARGTAQELKWRNATSFEVDGKGWAQTAGPFDRLPDSAKPKVNSTAWNLSKDSAGISIRFTTDASAVSVRWSLVNDSLAMPHMPATGCSGLDLYARAATGEWRFIGNCRPSKRDGNQSTIEFPDGTKAKRDCLLYLPVYNGTKSLEIGVPTGSQIDKPEVSTANRPKPVVVYGTSITQGGCASRPGMIWTSILGRMLDGPVINLGFSSSGDMAPPVGNVLAEIDAAAYVIDCTWNMGTGKEMFLDHVTSMVEAIRLTHPVTPILFMGQSMISPAAHPSERTRDLEFAVQSLQKAGAQNIMFVPPDDFIGSDGEGTVDGIHYTDIGMQRQAQALYPIVAIVLREGAVDKSNTKVPSAPIGRVRP
ncbi:MAG: SGNH/GDSL hydrolase family protein [Candidatus Sumerlaeaceae bacterium]|nr:SGNH/GDSL hydrolase family protein [Candidatus Sumerlaeaceae bacterium]